MTSSVVRRSEAVQRVVDLVASAPGLTHAEVARRLGGRRAIAVDQVRAAVTAGAVFEGPSSVPARGGSRRTVVGLFPDALTETQPALSLDAAATLRAARSSTRPRVSLDALAARLGVSRGLVHRWETGRQRMPAWAVRDLPGALEDAQTSDAPSRGSDARRRRELVAAVRRTPGLSRWKLAGNRASDRRLIEQARRAGELHEAPTWSGPTRFPGVGLFPGPRPKVDDATVSTAALRAARTAAGLSLTAMGRRVGVAGTTLARWERDLDRVPGWAVAQTSAALSSVRALARDDRAQVLAFVQDHPGLSRKRLESRMPLGWGRLRVAAQLDDLLAADAIHTEHTGGQGEREGLYPGPAPATVLTAGQLRTLRTRAGVDQRDLAEALGVNVDLVRKWEAGRPIPMDRQRQARGHLEQLPEAAASVRAAVLAAVPAHGATFHQIEQATGLSRRRLTATLAELEAAEAIHQGRVGAGVPDPQRSGRVSRGRAGYLPGPSPTPA